MRKLLGLLIIGILLASAPTIYADIVAPNGLETVEGDGNNIAPFGFPEVRYQQLYSASIFSVLTEPTLLTGLSFRPDKKYGNAFDVTIDDIMINLSTTTGGLTSTFANNVGLDNTTVLDRDSLSLSSADTGGTGGTARDFDISIEFDHGFLYDTAEGDLLLDIFIYSGVPMQGATPFDSHHDPSISRAYHTDMDVYAETANTRTPGYGLVTKFHTVPEPSLELLLGISLIGLIGASTVRKIKQRKVANS